MPNPQQREYEAFVAFCDRVGFNLEPFQRKIARALTGPQREVLVLLPRGQGKSRLEGTFGVFHLLTEPKAAAYIAANSEEQARICFEYARDVAMHPAVEEEFEVRYRELRAPDGGFLRVRAADAGKLLGLTPSWVCLDEYGAAKDDQVYASLRTSLPKRPGARMHIITTAGTGADSPLGVLRARALAAKDIRRRGPLTDARGKSLRMLEWAVDPEVSLDNYTEAKRANPGSWISRESLKETREAVGDIEYRRYNLNQWTGQVGSIFPPGAWSACADSPVIEPGERVWVAFDIGGSEADSAVMVVTEDLRVEPHIFEGEEAVLAVEELVPQLAQRYQIAELTGDDWQGAGILQKAKQRGINASVTPQSDSRMIAASRALYRAVTEGRLRHPDHQHLNEHVRHAVAKQKPRGWRIVAGGGNVDGCVALAMAVAIATAPQPEPVEFLGWVDL